MKKITIYHLPFTILFFLLAACGAAYANNMAVASAQLGAQDTDADTRVIQFDISWSNSWRDSTNYDAAWVFVKYSVDYGLTWSHATLKTAGTNPSGFSAGTGTAVDIVVPTDKKGAFIQRSAEGTGALSTSSMQFVWDYGTDISAGTKDADAQQAAIKVFAVEMVYIPAGSFYIGDGNGTSQSVGALFQAANTAVQLDTSLKQNIRAPTSYGDAQLVSPGIGIDGDGGLDADNDGVIDNANFPTGYGAFYLMKYEISQGHMRDFINTLSRAQQNNRTGVRTPDWYALTGTAALTSRNSIRVPRVVASSTTQVIFGCDLNGNYIFDESSDGEHIACNYMSGQALAAYADWAGLRPMTELEFEKACRGPNAPVYQEQSWGGTFMTSADTIVNSATVSEGVSETGTGLCHYGSAIGGPLRSGFSATASTATRAQSNAGYFGNTDLSGNLAERCVTIGNSTGRSFLGTHGDGALSVNGYATNSDWPGYTAGEVSANSNGFGLRGGNFGLSGSTLRFLYVSERSFAAYLIGGTNSNGGRCTRTAP